MLCPTRFVVDATENSKASVAAEVCRSQTGLWTKWKGNVILLLPGSPKWHHFRRGNLWTLYNQHHPPPNISVWSDARQRKPLAKWVGVGHQVGEKRGKYVLCAKKKQRSQMKNIQHTSATKSIATKQKSSIKTWLAKYYEVSKMGGGHHIDYRSNNDFVRCCGRGRKNVTSVPRWRGWLVVPGLWYKVYLIGDVFVFVL